PEYDGPDVSKCDGSDISECNGSNSLEQDGPKCVSSGCSGSEYDCLEYDEKFIFDESFKGDQNGAKTKDQDDTSKFVHFLETFL
ncbi:8030_t:CDS:1, partial [Cetraspora pellucida]